jgi:uncharacterized membrane protein YcaP (DUF421 family)
MLDMISEQARVLLGLGNDLRDVDAIQMALRTIVIYLFTLAIIRIGSKRFLGESTAFDFIVSIMLGSIMSRAVNGTAPFGPTLAAGVVLLFIHWVFAMLAFHSRWFGFVVKGEPILLIKDGVVQEKGMQRSHITANDLTGALRIQTNQTDPAKVKLAYLERNGQISIISQEREPRIVTLSIEDGVQTVRIEMV